MRSIHTSCLFVFLLVVSAVPAHAEEVETDGFTMKVPAGFRKAIDSETAGGNVSFHFNFPMMDAFMDGTPDMKVYVKGTEAEPESALVACYIPMKGSQTEISNSELGIAGDQLGAMLPQGFSMEKKTFDGEYEGIVVKGHLEDVPQAYGVEGSFRMAMIACGDYAVVLGLVSFGADANVDSDFTWTQMTGSLKITPPTNWTTILLILLSCSGAIVFVFRVLMKKPPQIRYATDGGVGGVNAYAPRQTGARTMDGLPSYGQQPEPAQTFSPAEADLPPAHTPVPPPNVPVRPAATPKPKPAQRSPTPAPTPASTSDGAEAPGSGLRSTLPPSGRWSDQFNNK